MAKVKLTKATVPKPTHVTAKYRCMSKECGATSEHFPVRQGPCERCGHEYVEWLNYDSYMEQFNK